MSTFVDYAPLVFRRLRHMCGVSEDEYALSLSPEQLVGSLLLLRGRLTSLSERPSDGKSGNFFYSSHDGLFLCKTVSHDELGTLRSMLPRYVRHLERHPGSLLCRYFGLHQLDQTPFVVMGNAFETTRTVDHVFDLKGSTYKRTNPDPRGVRKDLDWTRAGRRIRIGPHRRQQLLHQIRADCEFLKAGEIIDYSLLIGISRVHPHERIELAGACTMVSERHSIPAHKSFNGGILSEDGTEVYFVSIIDTLVHYGIKKFAEHWLKAAWTGDGHAISVTDPATYAERFMSFMGEIIV